MFERFHSFIKVPLWLRLNRVIFESLHCLLYKGLFREVLKATSSLVDKLFFIPIIDPVIEKPLPYKRSMIISYVLVTKIKSLSWYTIVVHHYPCIFDNSFSIMTFGNKSHLRFTLRSNCILKNSIKAFWKCLI